MGCIVGQAIGLAMITVVGRCVGAQQLDQASYLPKSCCCGITLPRALPMPDLIFLNPLLSVYTLSDDPPPGLAAGYDPCGQRHLPVAGGLCSAHALRAANDVRFTMLTSILSMGIWRLAFSYILCVQMGMGAVGVWIAMVVDWVCRVTCFVVRFVSGAWKKKCVAK